MKGYRCKGRTSTGRVMKGWRLTRGGGLVKAGTRTGRSRPRKRKAAAGTIAAAVNLLAGKPRAASKRRRTAPKRSAPKRRRRVGARIIYHTPAGPQRARATARRRARAITATKRGVGVIVVDSGGTAYKPQHAELVGLVGRKPAAKSKLRRRGVISPQLALGI